MGYICMLVYANKDTNSVIEWSVAMLVRESSVNIFVLKVRLIIYSLV